MFSTPLPLRNFYFSFSPSRRSSASSKPGSHPRGASLSVTNIPQDSSPMSLGPSTRRSHSPWSVAPKLHRPTVLGHFSPATHGSPETEGPRASSSSNGSYSTRPSFDTPSTVPTTFSLPSTQFSSNHRKWSPSLWSLPSSATHLNDPPGSTKLVSQTSRSTIRVPFSLRPLSYASDTMSDVLSGSRNKRRKKRLVVSGIAPDDSARFEGIRQWCEVRQCLH
jgi:hypothetical protein